jgi:hypothetical protein
MADTPSQKLLGAGTPMVSQGQEGRQLQFLRYWWMKRYGPPRLLEPVQEGRQLQFLRY